MNEQIEGVRPRDFDAASDAFGEALDLLGPLPGGWDTDGSPGDLYDPPSACESVCDTCRVPESRWPTDHPLHREGSGQCAWCRQADIEDDRRYARELDV